jgi:hypothetical protein
MPDNCCKAKSVVPIKTTVAKEENELFRKTFFLKKSGKKSNPLTLDMEKASNHIKYLKEMTENNHESYKLDELKRIICKYESLIYEGRSLNKQELNQKVSKNKKIKSKEIKGAQIDKLISKKWKAKYERELNKVKKEGKKTDSRMKEKITEELVNKMIKNSYNQDEIQSKLNSIIEKRKIIQLKEKSNNKMQKVETLKINLKREQFERYKSLKHKHDFSSINIDRKKEIYKNNDPRGPKELEFRDFIFEIETFSSEEGSYPREIYSKMYGVKIPSEQDYSNDEFSFISYELAMCKFDDKRSEIKKMKIHSTTDYYFLLKRINPIL